MILFAMSSTILSRPPDLCVLHKEPLKLFCHDDEELLCCVCHTSKKHQGHRVCPMEEAALDLKVSFQTGAAAGLVFMELFL